jgi:Protein of unknown function (DUF3800)
MFLMFADESGDSGLINSPSSFFALAGLVVHELRWRACFEQIMDFRRKLRDDVGLKLREEIHAGALISRPGPLARIQKHLRLKIVRDFADQLASMEELNVISVLVDKQNKSAGYDVFENAWRALIQRFENTIKCGNFSGPRNADDRGLLVCDNTEGKKLISLVRRMNVYNPIPHQPHFGTGYRNLALQFLIEDPVFRESEWSQFIQAADVCAYLLYEFARPSSYMRQKGGRNYFKRLKPILCLRASPGDEFGIVRL